MTIHCPACSGNVPRQPLRTFGHAEAAQHFVLAEEFPEQHARLTAHIAKLWGGTQCSLLACSGCGLQFAWPFVAGDGAFYNLAYPYSDYPSERWEWERTLQSLQRDPVPGGPVLEIGSGFGYFLRKLSPALVAPERVRAIEYNDTARAQITAHGYTAYGVDVRDARFTAWRGQLGAVFMFQVLEHMDGLDALFTRLAELLAPGASVFIAVPNVHRISFNERHDSLLDMPPNHISRWTEDSFTALAERLGWTVAERDVQPLAWAEFMKHDLVYAHMRRAQRSGSLANRIRGRRRTPARVAMEGVVALGAAPARARAWLSAAAGGQPLGDSIWVRLKVPAAPGGSA